MCCNEMYLLIFMHLQKTKTLKNPEIGLVKGKRLVIVNVLVIIMTV